MINLRIELGVGTKLIIDGYKCQVVECKSCKECIIHAMTINNTDSLGHSLRCGYKRITTQCLLCAKKDRSDEKDVIFKQIK